jgi:hypothetical protein
MNKYNISKSSVSSAILGWGTRQHHHPLHKQQGTSISGIEPCCSSAALLMSKDSLFFSLDYTQANASSFILLNHFLHLDHSIYYFHPNNPRTLFLNMAHAHSYICPNQG